MGRISAFTWRWCLRFVDYWKNIGNDYRTVCMDVIYDCKERPVKATIIATALAALTYAYKTNPTERDMLNALADHRQIMVLVPNSIHNPEADRALASRTLYLDQQRLEHIDCFFFSLALRRPYDRNIRVYHSQDASMKGAWWRELWENTIDIGAFGRWYNLNKSFQNYDINEDEFNNDDSL